MNIQWYYDTNYNPSGDKSIIYYDPYIDIALSFQPSYSMFLDSIDINEIPDNITPYDYYKKEFHITTNNENKFYCYISDYEVEDPWGIFDDDCFADELRSELLSYIEKNNLLKTSKNAIKAYRHILEAQDAI